MGLTLGRRTLLAAVCAVAVASIYAAQPVLAQMGRGTGVPDARLGWIVAVGQFGYLAGLAVLVPLGDMVDRRRLIAGHLLLTAAGTALAMTARHAWMLFAGMAMAGLFAVVVQTTVAFAADLSAPEERGRNLGAVTSGVVTGILGARVVAGTLAELWGWRSVYAALTVLLTALAGLVLRILPPDPRAEGAEGADHADHADHADRAGRAAYRRVLMSLAGLFSERLFLSRGLIAFFLFASFGTLWSGLALPLAAAPWHLSTAQIGLFGLAGLAGALGAVRAGRWADAGHTGPVTGAALVLLLLSWPAIGQATWSLWLVVVGVIALDFAVQAVHVSNQHLLTTAHPGRTSSVVGGYMIFYSLGSAVGAATTTTAFADHGWTGSAVLGALFAGGALAVWAVGAWAVKVQAVGSPRTSDGRRKSSQHSTPPRCLERCAGPDPGCRVQGRRRR